MLSQLRAGSTGQVRGRAMPGTSEVHRGLMVTPMLSGSRCRAVPCCGWAAEAGPALALPRPWVKVLVGLDAFAMARAARTLRIWSSGARAVLCGSFTAEM